MAVKRSIVSNSERDFTAYTLQTRLCQNAEKVYLSYENILYTMYSSKRKLLPCACIDIQKHLPTNTPQSTNIKLWAMRNAPTPLGDEFSNSFLSGHICVANYMLLDKM